MSLSVLVPDPVAAIGPASSTVVAVEQVLAKVPVPKMFADNSGFNTYCSALCSTWRDSNMAPPQSPSFSLLLARIERGPKEVDGKILVIPTPWGGVDVLRYDHPHVEKHLVVTGGKYLAYEFHHEKAERLWVHEGVGVLLTKKVGAAEITAQPFVTGSYAQFAPGDEHCVIALDDMVVYESSTDPRGMDKDLQLKFTPVVAS